MSKFEQFKEFLLGINSDKLSDLCERFIYDHEAATKTTKELSDSFGLTLTMENIKDYITEMHKDGDFDDVYCWGIQLGSNDLYKKFHPQK